MHVYCRFRLDDRACSLLTPGMRDLPSCRCTAFMTAGNKCLYYMYLLYLGRHPVA